MNGNGAFGIPPLAHYAIGSRPEGTSEELACRRSRPSFHREAPTSLLIRQEWLLKTFGGLVNLTLLRMSVQKIMLHDEDEIEEDADVPEPEFDWIPNNSAPVGLKAGVNKQLKK